MAKQGGYEKSKAFTLMELMIAVILIGIIAGFGVPNFRKAVQKGRERNGILHLKTIHGASMIYFAKTGDYAPGIGLNLAGINSALSINIIDNNMVYSYTGSTGGILISTFSATASWTGTNPFTVQINHNPITASNPCCSAGTCLIAPNC